MKTEKISDEELAKKYNSKTSTYSKLLLILFVPMFAIIFSILNYKRSRYFADHTLMALEFMSFVLFYGTILFAFILLGLDKLSGWAGESWNLLRMNEWTFSTPLIVISIFYFLFRCQRTFYDQKIHWAIVKATLFIATIPYAYRFMLFHITISTI